MTNDDLDMIFGSSSTGGVDFEKRAKTSKIQFVRSQDELAVYSGRERGRIYNAYQAYKIFGISKLLEANLYGTAVLVSDYDEPAKTIKSRREHFGLSVGDLSKHTGLSEEQICTIEDPSKNNPIRTIEKLARALALNELNVSEIGTFNKSSSLAIRLKTLSSTAALITRKDVMAIADATWVIGKQNELLRMIRNQKELAWEKYEKDNNYGSSDYPAWQHGYYLAYKVRDLLGLTQTKPVESLREICEMKLNIPLVYANLSSNIAGVTIANGSSRGIILNSANFGNTWIKRIALAHEIGHLLWDSDEKLVEIVIDKVETIEDIASKDYIEQRANAFAVEFLAPQKGIDEYCKRENIDAGDVSKVLSQYGISFSACKYQYWNTVERTIDKSDIHASRIEPEADWDGRERFAVDYYPVDQVPISCRGLFSKIVIEAVP